MRADFRDRRTDRTEQHPGESPATVTADDRQLRGLRLLEQLMGGPVEDDDTSDRHIGIALLPSRQPLGQRLVCLLLQVGPLDAGQLGHREVAPRVHRNKFHAAA